MLSLIENVENFKDLVKKFMDIFVMKHVGL